MRCRHVILSHDLIALNVFKSFLSGFGWGGLRHKGFLMRWRRDRHLRDRANGMSRREGVVEDGVEHLDCLLQIEQAGR